MEAATACSSQQQNMQMRNPIESDSNSVTSVTTLLVRNLPEAIPHDMLSRLFSHYGASTLRPSPTSRLRNCAFVDFKNEAVAYQAQRQLNGLRFLGKVLKVEKAKSVEDNKVKQGEGQLRVDPIASRSLMTDAVLTQNLSGQKPGIVPTGEPIAPRLGVEYPFPPHLEYAYPPPDGNILTNIVNALIAVPRFYTQVLHLMNKMNLPAPFRVALPTPPLPPSMPAAAPLQPPPHAAPSDINPQLADTSSDESEMDSSDEGLDERSSAGDLGYPKPGHKRVKRENIVGPAVDKDVAHEAVGVKPSTLTPKEIPKIKTNAPVLKIKITPRIAQSQTKDDKMEDLKDSNIEHQETKSYLTAEEIEREKLPPEEILSLPTFKNYTAGSPAPVLYIKNLAKDVVADDFYFVFGSLFRSVDEAKAGLNVRLMQEGRMRGQAFVTFPSVQLAQHALNLVHGYVFKGKPMIIQFGRNPGAAKTN